MFKAFSLSLIAATFSIGAFAAELPNFVGTYKVVGECEYRSDYKERLSIKENRRENDALDVQFYGQDAALIEMFLGDEIVSDKSSPNPNAKIHREGSLDGETFTSSLTYMLGSNPVGEPEVTVLTLSDDRKQVEVTIHEGSAREIQCTFARR